MADSGKNDDKAPIIVIKRVKKVEGGHHGGAWKIALADFMTAMFAFFLVMWIVGSVTEDKKKGLSEYFSPTLASRSSSNGAGGILGGTFLSANGSLNSSGAASTGNKFSDAAEREKKMQEETQETNPAVGKDSNQDSLEKMDEQDNKSFSETSDEIREKIAQESGLGDMGDNLLIDVTPEGLRIQIVDSKGKEMFKGGSPEPLPHTVKIIQIVSQIIKELPNKISVRGHTDSTASPDKMYSNWELSSDRANATRRIMENASIKPDKIENVQGRADREQLDASNPNSIRNRRVSIMLIKQSISATKNKIEHSAKKPGGSSKSEPRKREEGVIYFP